MSLFKETFGHRIIWTRTTNHWEIRRGFTIHGYESQEFSEMLQSAENVSGRRNADIYRLLNHRYKIMRAVI